MTDEEKLDQNIKALIEINTYKLEMRVVALESTPSSKPTDQIYTSVRLLTATEKVAEADIIYQWLIKDL